MGSRRGDKTIPARSLQLGASFDSSRPICEGACTKPVHDTLGAEICPLDVRGELAQNGEAGAETCPGPIGQLLALKGAELKDSNA